MNDNSKKNENGKNEEKEVEEKEEKMRGCADCGFKYKEIDMMERRDGRGFCRRCISRNQLP